MAPVGPSARAVCVGDVAVARAVAGRKKRGRPKGAPGLMVFVAAEVEAWLRAEARRTGVPATNIMELALLRLMHSRPDAGLEELRETAGPGAAVDAALVTIGEPVVVPATMPDKDINPAVVAAFGIQTGRKK